MIEAGHGGAVWDYGWGFFQAVVAIMIVRLKKQKAAKGTKI